MTVRRSYITLSQSISAPTKKNKVNRTTKANIFHSSSYHKWLPYQILGGKTVKNVQIDHKTTEIWPKELFVTLSVSE